MNLEQVFSLASGIALLSWVLLFAFYQKNWVYKLLFSVVLMLLALVYVFFLGKGLIFGEAQGDFNSLAGVKTLMSSDQALLAGWIHYLAFDLFVGMWEAQDAKKRGVNRWLLLPCLLGTFMAGPFGLLLYFIFRSLKSSTLLQHPYQAA
jgi:hypothetical protein